jgi:hypothetical protein
MRTLVAGLRALRRAPAAILPLAIEGLMGALLVAFRAFPADGAAAPATAAFPLDVYFDVKQALAYAPGWAWFVAAVGLGVLVRGGVLASTLWLSEGRPGSFATGWWRATKLALVSGLALFPCAALFFVGVAIRYAPFVWIAAVLGLIPAILLTRRAVRLDVGGGEPPGKGVPEAPGWLSYAYLVTAFGAAMTILGRTSPWLAGMLLLLLGPLHALFLLGWREHLARETYPGGGTISVTMTVVVVGALLMFTFYDRMVRTPIPAARAPASGTLLLLGGVDSSSTTGALTELDPRELGFRDSRTVVLSYRADGAAYKAADTRVDLSEVGSAVSQQIASATPPRLLLGHSQAALILDRLLDEGLDGPDRAVLLAAPPPYPPPVSAPAPNLDGTGRPGADVARGFAKLMDWVGWTPFDIDVPDSPVRLARVVAARSDVPRLAIWALGDSVWLEGDWRRPGEVNVVAVTDHVGVTNDERALTTARDFFSGRRIEDDSASWRGFAVALLSHAFAPWRPSD